METPKISVIIPVYNTASYLQESVGSIMHQTLRDLEIIIVDDGSTDNSGEILREMAEKDERIQLFSQRNEGQSSARNTALKYASGEYIYFMDSDDILHPDALRQCYERSHVKQLDILFFDGDILYEKEQNPLSWDYQRTCIYDEKQVYIGVSLLDDMLEHGSYRAVPWLYLVNRTYLEHIRLLFYPGIIHEDELFTVLLFIQAGRVGCIKQTLVQHRVRNNSTMTRKYSIRNVRCYLTVMDELFSYTRTHASTIPLIRKYAAYTLRGVFETAFQLPFIDKCKVYIRCWKTGYLRYISALLQIKFWIKH